VDTGTGDDVAQEGKLGDASVLYLDVMEAVESLLVGAIKQAKGIEEAERGLGSELGLEGVEGRGSLGRRRGKGSGRSRKGGEGDTLKKKLSIEEVQDTFFVAITTHDPPLAHSISNSISSFSTTPHPTDKTAPDIPVELTTSFRLLGQPVGSATFATEFFDRRIDDVKKNVTSLLGNITDQQTRLRLFSQCIIQKIPHLLCRRSLSFTNRQPKPTLGRMERPTYLQHRLHYQSIFLLTTHNCEHYPQTYPNIPSSSANWAYEPTVLVSSAPTHVLLQTLSLLWHPPAEMLSIASESTRTSPTSPSTKPLARYLKSLPTPPPRSYNDSTLSSHTLQKSPAPHPFLLNSCVITVLGDSYWSRGLVLCVLSREKFLRGSICV
jgi:hypothetical protein